MFSKFFSRLGTSQSRNNSYNTNESTKRVARSLGSLVLVFALVIGLVLSSYGASFAAGEFNIAFTSDMHDTPNVSVNSRAHPLKKHPAGLVA